MNTTNGFRALSPDGIDVNCYPLYKTRARAEKAIQVFVERYTAQGYYSTSDRERIPVNEIANHCTIVHA